MGQNIKIKGTTPIGYKPKPKPPKFAVGRPTKYRKEYCELLVEHFSKGLSYQSFAGVVYVNIDTLYEWEKVHKDFSDAKRRGEPLRILALEEILIGGSTGAIKGFNAAAIIFALKNAGDWSDKKEIKHSGSMSYHEHIVNELEKLKKEDDARFKESTLESEPPLQNSNEGWKP